MVTGPISRASKHRYYGLAVTVRSFDHAKLSWRRSWDSTGDGNEYLGLLSGSSRICVPSQSPPRARIALLPHDRFLVASTPYHHPPYSFPWVSSSAVSHTVDVRQSTIPKLHLRHLSNTSSGDQEVQTLLHQAVITW